MPDEDDEIERPKDDGWTFVKVDRMLRLLQEAEGMSDEEMIEFLEDFLRRHTH